MLTFEQFLLENTKHVAADDMEIGGFHIDNGDTYYLNDAGQLDREDGPAVIGRIYSFWLRNGKIHRVGAPAVKGRNGYESWYIDGIRHKLDGPAVKGKSSGMWYIRGKHLNANTATDEDKWALLMANIPHNFDFLNELGMTKEMQEYICQHRPDLAAGIKDLDPELVKKYQHEVGLGYVDL